VRTGGAAGDLRALYHYIRSLGPVGDPAPAFLPPDRVPPRPYNQLPDLSRSSAPARAEEARAS